MERDDVGRILKSWLAILFAVGAGFALRDCLSCVAHADEPVTQAECFLGHRRGGSDRLSHARQRAWVRELDGLARNAVAASSLEDSTTITPGLVLAVAFHESSWHPRARGPRREYGLMQILPSRLRADGLRAGEDPLDPAVNLRLGVEGLRQCEAMCPRDDRGDVLRCYAVGRCDRLDRDGDGRRERDRKVEIMQAWADQADGCVDRR